MKVIHEGLRSYQCQACSKIFSYARSLRVHQEKVCQRSSQKIQPGAATFKTKAVKRLQQAKKIKIKCEIEDARSLAEEAKLIEMMKDPVVKSEPEDEEYFQGAEEKFQVNAAGDNFQKVEDSYRYQEVDKCVQELPQMMDVATQTDLCVSSIDKEIQDKLAFLQRASTVVKDFEFVMNQLMESKNFP